MKCSTCRKAEEELDSAWDTIRLKFFHLFHNDIIDLSQDKYTQGFGDGYKVGYKHALTRDEAYVEATGIEDKGVVIKQFHNCSGSGKCIHVR